MHCSVQQEEEEEDWQGFLHFLPDAEETMEEVLKDFVIVYIIYI
jgi:hypothetical protein